MLPHRNPVTCQSLIEYVAVRWLDSRKCQASRSGIDIPGKRVRHTLSLSSNSFRMSIVTKQQLVIMTELREGDSAPEFTLPGSGSDVESTEIWDYSLAEATEAGPAILTFYLFDFNPHCSTHLCGLRDAVGFDLIPPTDVLAISTDRTFSHRAFADRFDLEFPLLSDSD